MDLAVSRLNGRGNNQSVFQTLVIAFSVIMVHVFGHGTA